jgi:hypothetical protein
MTKKPLRDERGAILMQTAIALIGLLAFGSFTMDYGVLWVARGQAQNAADAGALAAAISMAYGDRTAVDFEPRVRSVGVAAARTNMVWGAAPAVDPVTDITIGPCPPGAPGLPDQCVRVDVYRNQQRGNALPTFFAQLVGVTEHGVRATATAQVLSGRRTTCLKPWVIPDKWEEIRPTAKPWSLEDSFNRYQVNGQTYTLLNPADYYTPPSPTAAGTGFTLPGDIGRRVKLQVKNWSDSSIASGNFRSVVLPGPCGDTGGDSFRCNIATCNPTPVGIGDILETEPGVMAGPTQQGLQTLIGADSAYWECNGSPASRSVDCAGAPSAATPRLVPIAAFNVQRYLEDTAAGLVKTNGRTDVTIVRVLGFFIEGWDSKEIWGRFSFYPAPPSIGSNDVADSANFLRSVILVR